MKNLFLARIKPFLFILLVANLFLFFIPSKAMGNDCIWQGGNGDDWTTSSNWSGCNNFYPYLIGDTATFGVTGHDLVTIVATDGFIEIGDVIFTSNADPYIFTITNNVANPTTSLGTFDLNTNGSGNFVEFQLSCDNTLAGASYCLAIGGGAGNNLSFLNTNKASLFLNNFTATNTSFAFNGGSSAFVSFGTSTLGTGTTVSIGSNNLADFSGTNGGGATVTNTGTGSNSSGVNAGIRISSDGSIGQLVSSGLITLNGGTLTVGALGGASTSSGVISGPGSLTYNAPSGTFTLSANNTFTGTTTVNGSGQMTLSGAGNIVGGLAVNSGTFNFSGITAGALTVTSLSGSPGGSIVMAGKNLTVNQTGTTTFGGAMSGSGGSFTFEGGGNLTLTGTNTYDGLTTLTNGTLNIGTSQAMPAGSIAGPITVNGGTLNVFGTVGGTLTNNAQTNFYATAGSILILNDTASSVFNFENNSSAGTSSITNESSATMNFLGNSTAGSSTITNTNSGTLITFQNTSTAGNASISNQARILFENTSTAGNVSISNFNGGSVTFQNTSTASNASITNSNPSFLTFQDSSIAGTATISNAGSISFQNTSTAGAAFISNLSTGSISFQNTSTANNATISNAGSIDLTLLTSGALTIGNLSGTAGTITLGSNTLTVNTLLGPSGSNTISSIISGAGGLTIGGSGNTTLNVTELYTGMTTVNPGAMLTVTGSINSSSSLLNNGTTFLNTPTTVTLPIVDNGSLLLGNVTVQGAISGSGTVSTVTGDTANLNGANTYSGLTMVSSGSTLNVNGSLVGNTTVNSTGILNVFGSIGNELTNNGTATFFNAAPTIATVINNGSLDISNITLSPFTIGTLTGTGNIILGTENLNVGSATNSTYFGTFTGSGNITKQGSGLLVLDGNNNTYTGLTTVSAGTLEIGDASHRNASIGGSTVINAGATLMGFGTAGTTPGNTFTNNGTFIPGGGDDQPATTFTINGNYTQSAPATYVVNFDPTGTQSQSHITGTANLGNGMLMIDTMGHPLVIGTPYIILTADGGLGDTKFGMTFSGSKFFGETIVYTPTQVEILFGLNNTAILNATKTPNQKAVAKHIIATNGNPSINADISMFTTNDQLLAFLDQLSAATYANQQMILSQVERGFSDKLASRLDVYEVCVNREIAYYEKEIDTIYYCNDKLFWASIYGGNANLDPNEGISGIDTHQKAVMIGFETLVSPIDMVGVAFGWVSYSGDATENENADFSADLYQIGLYWREQFLNWRIGAAAEFAFTQQLNSTREIENVLIPGVETASYNNTLYAVQGRVSNRYAVVDTFNIQPIIGVIFQQVNTDNFTEEGFFDYAVSVSPKSFNSLRSQFGVEFDLNLSYNSLWPSLYAGWEHEFLDQNGQFSEEFQSFATGPNASFTIVGAQTGREFLVLQAGLEYQTGWIDLSVSYEGRFTNKFNQNLLIFELAYF